MMIPNSFLIVCAVIGFAIALLLWWFVGIPWWAILLVTVGVPVAVAIVLMVLFYAAWMAAGCH